MKTRSKHRFLCLLLVVLMLVSLFPAAALAADTDTTSTWEKADLDKITSEDVVAITMTKGDVTYALPAAKSSSAPTAAVGSVESGALTLTGEKAAFGWTITKSADDDTYSIKNADNDALYVTAANAGVRVGTPEDASWGAFSLENGFLSAKDSKNATRYVGVYADNPDWRCYTSINDNIKDETLGFWKFVSEAEPEPTTEPVEPTLLAKLDAAPADGDTVVIYHPDSKTVLTGTASGKKLAGTAATMTDAQIEKTDDMAMLKVSVADGVYTFELDGKYLTSGATGNSLTFAEDAASDLAKWTLEQQSDGTWYIKNVGANYNGNHNQALEYYSGFTTFGVKDNNAAYKFEFYAVINSDPASGLKTGDTVAIFNDGNGKAVTATASGSKLAATDAKLGEDGKLTGKDIALFTVTVNDDGTVTFANDGKYLTTGATGSSLMLADAASEYSLWIIEDAGDGLFFIRSANAQYSGKAQYLEYYNTFTTFGKSSSTAAFAMSFRAVAEETPDDPTPSGTTYGLASKLSDGDSVILYNAKNGVALGNTIASHKVSGVALTPADGVITTDNADVVWKVTVNSDGTYTFKQGDKTLGGVVSGTYNNLVVTNAAHINWTLTGPDSSDFNYFLRLDDMSNQYGKLYLEYFDGFTLYGSSAPTKEAFGITFYKQGAEPETPSGEEPGDGVLQAGDRVVIYNAEAGGSLGLDSAGTGTSLGNIPTDIREGNAYPNNGAYVFTVGVENGCYTFSAGGKYLATCDKEQLFLADAKSDTGESCAYWQLEKKGDGYLIKSKTARYNGNGVVCIEFFAGAFSGYTFKSDSQSIFIFNFYPVAEGVNTLDGTVNNPKVVFTSEESVIKQDAYKAAFTLDDLAPAEQIASVKATVNGSEVADLANTGKNYTFTVPGETTAVNTELKLVVTATYASGESYTGDFTVAVKDEPLLLDLKPEPNSETGADKMPVISAAVKNADDDATVEMTVNGAAVAATLKDGVVSYQPTEPLKDGRTSVKITVTRPDGAKGEKSWSFTIGVATARLYFGQLHSHTTYSDGSGSLETALDYIKNIPESANVQFVAFTDHSNYFDTTGAANPEDALYDMSLASESSQKLWNEYRQTVADFNASQSDIIAIAGFEMTWSGGPGHINTFNSPGIVSRNNSTLNNKTNDAGMKAYYALLNREEGADTLSQFNHPGKTFGNFTDFSYWNAVTDSRIFMVEVGNGEGQIGAGGYYPSYEQYIMALDKGWHVAPTNNQDNHKGRWGNANDARDVILTDDFSEDGIYDAIRAMRMYATEDKNLELYYTVNEQPLGSILSEVPEQLQLKVQVSDPDSKDRISKVEVVVNSGKVVHTWDDAAALSSGALTVTLAPDYSYYFIRVTEADGDLAVTAPVWVGETLKLGISAFESETAMPVTGEELTLKTTLYNSEGKEATVKSITYTTSGSKVLGVDTEGYTVPASGTLEIPFQYTPDVAKVMTITATVVMEQNGKEYTFTKDLTLDVQNADDLVYIGIDASHYNEYVAGNYKDSMGNFAALAAEHAVRTVYFSTSEDLISACGNEKYKMIIFTAPSRRLQAAQNEMRCYTAEEIAAIQAFNNAGGTVVLAGWSDYYENYASVQAAGTDKHMAGQQNAILAALGSSLRISDDATHDPELNGGQTQRLYFSTYNMDNPLMAGIVVDPEHPNDRAYSEVFSHYGGASIYAVDADGKPVAVLPDTVSPAVYGHSTTYSLDSDKDGLGGESVPKYAVGEGDSRLLITATEELPDKGMIVVSGAAFMSNFEVQAAASSGSSDADTQKNYSNYKFCENLISPLNTAKVSTIDEVRKQTEEGFKYTIEGTVTSNASGYDKDTAFFDCIYVQDETGGICCFPVSGDFKVGDKVRVTGTTDFYQGEPELQVTSIAVIGEGEVQPQEVSAKDVTSREAEGKLITVKGTVVSHAVENGLIQTIMVKDAKGDVVRVFIDGYITTGKEVENLSDGCAITVTGLASYDDTFNAPDGPFPRIRIRDRADVVCTADSDKCDGGKDCPSIKLADVDRTPDSWYHEAVDWAYVEGVTTGTTATTFSPDAACTRAQAVTFLWRAKGEPAPKSTKCDFTDINPGEYYYKAVLWAVENEITNGVGNNRFDPEGTCTRAQIVTFLWRAEDKPAARNASSFPDVPAGTWYTAAVAWAVEQQITEGMADGTFKPDDTCTRAHIVTFLWRDMTQK